MSTNIWLVCMLCWSGVAVILALIHILLRMGSSCGDIDGVD